MNIYVGNLSLAVTETELRREFTTFGQVISVNVMNDKYIGSGQPRGYAFIEMASRSEGEAAIVGLNGKVLKDRVLNVIEALPLSNDSGIGSGNIRRRNHFTRRVRERS